MRTWRFSLVALLAWALPSAAFIFVPQRGAERVLLTPVEPSEVTEGSVTADLDGELYWATPKRLYGLGPAGDERLAVHTPTAGQHLVEAPLPGDGVLMVSTRPDGDDRGPLTLTCLAIPFGPRQDPPETRWQHTFADVPPGGVHLPLQTEPELTDHGVVAVLSGGELLVIGLETGEVDRRVPLGTLHAPPLWLGNMGLFAVTGDTDPFLLAVTLAPAEPALAASCPLPADARVTALERLRDDLVLVRGEQGRWLFTPAPAPSLLPLPGEGAVALGADGWVYAVDGDALRAVRLLAPGEPRTWALPAGEQAVGPLAAGEAGVVVATAAGPGDAVTVTALRPDLSGVLWRRRVRGLAADGLYVPRVPAGDLGLVGVLADQQLTVLELATGRERGQRPLGEFAGRPTWVEDTGLVLATRPGGQPALHVFDLSATGTDRDPSADWVWTLPPEETLVRLEWLPRAGRMVAYGRHGVRLLG